jgi:hypothetical protein
MSKKYLIPLLIILAVPIFLLLVKITSELEKMLFGWNNSDSIAGAIFLIVVAIIFAVVSFVITNDKRSFL